MGKIRFIPQNGRMESVIEQNGVKQKIHNAGKHSFCYLAKNSKQKISGVNHREACSAQPNILFHSQVVKICTRKKNHRFDMIFAFSCCCSGRDVTGTGTGTKQLHFSKTEKKARKTVQKNSV
jgi:hypothetical protein